MSILEVKIDDHRMAFESPDLVFITIRGDIDGRQMDALVGHVLDVASGAPHILILADLGGMGDITPEARRSTLRLRNRVPYRGMAFFNGSFKTRILVKFILGALALLSKPADNPLRFCDNEAEARAWLKGRRRELAAARERRRG